MNRQIGVKKFIRVVILDRDTWHRHTAHAQPQNCHGPLCTAKKAVLQYCRYLWNYNTDRQEISGQYLHNENVSGDAVLWRQQIQDGERPPFWRSLNHNISVKNHPILIKFGTLKQILNPMTVKWPKIEIFKIQDGCGRHLANRFFGHKSSLSDFSKILYEEAERQVDKGYGTKNANF